MFIFMVFPLIMGCFTPLKISIMVRAFITWFTFITSFLYGIFIWCISSIWGKWNTSELYKTNCFHNFSCSIIIPHLTVHQDKQKNFQIPSTHKDFLQCELGEVPSKIRKPIHCKLLSYSECLPKIESDNFLTVLG